MPEGAWTEKAPAGVAISKGGVLFGATYDSGSANFGTVYALKP